MMAIISPVRPIIALMRAIAVTTIIVATIIRTEVADCASRCRASDRCPWIAIG
jgi:hypothetical protein